MGRRREKIERKEEEEGENGQREERESRRKRNKMILVFVFLTVSIKIETLYFNHSTFLPFQHKQKFELSFHF